MSLESKLNCVLIDYRLWAAKSEGRPWVDHCINLYVDHCLSHCLDHHPEPRSGLCPELLADFRIPKPPGCSQGAQRAVFCAVRVADCLAEGAGWGASAGREIGSASCRDGIETKGAARSEGRQSVDQFISLYVDHCLSHCLDHHPEPRSGLCPELLADFRIPKPPGCSQGAQRAVFCAVRVADFLAEGAGWGASPGRGGELGCPPAASVLKKFVRLASAKEKPTPISQIF